MDQFLIEVGQAFCVRWERLQFWIRRPASDDVEANQVSSETDQVSPSVPQDPIRFAAQCWAEQDGQVSPGVPIRDQQVSPGVPIRDPSEFADLERVVEDEM